MSERKGAGEALSAALAAALRGVNGLTGIYEGQPLQASFPYAVVDCGLESEWGHKSGEGREVRIAVTLRDKGERPARLRRQIAASEAALAAGELAPDGWRLVTLHFLRSRLLRDSGGQWAGIVEYRARLLAEPAGGNG